MREKTWKSWTITVFATDRRRGRRTPSGAVVAFLALRHKKQRYLATLSKFHESPCRVHYRGHIFFVLFYRT